MFVKQVELQIVKLINLSATFDGLLKLSCHKGVVFYSSLEACICQDIYDVTMISQWTPSIPPEDSGVLSVYSSLSYPRYAPQVLPAIIRHLNLASWARV